MRVHLGSDHAGLDLKAHLAGWLTEHGYEPVDHGPFQYDALDDYPVFCLRAAEGVALDRTQGLDSLGVVIGGSGRRSSTTRSSTRPRPVRRTRSVPPRPSTRGRPRGTGGSTRAPTTT